MINGISDHRLEEIELRLVGCDHRPWGVSGLEGLDDEGRRTIMRRSRKAQKRAIKEAARVADVALIEGKKAGKWTKEELDEAGCGENGEPMIHGPTLSKHLVLFHKTDLVTDDTLEFVAQAPQDVEDLLREVKQLRIMCAKAKQERHDAVQELQGTKVAASRAEEKRRFHALRIFSGRSRPRTPRTCSVSRKHSAPSIA